MVHQGISEYGEAAIIERAVRFFGAPGLGLGFVSQSTNAISFSGEAGSINVTVIEQGAQSWVQVLADPGLDADADRFLNEISTERLPPDAPAPP